MAEYSLDLAKAKAVQGRIENSSAQIAKLLQEYAQAKQQLLSAWEGSMKDYFVQETGQNVEANGQALIDSLKKVASALELEIEDIRKRSVTAADIVGGK